MRVKFALLAGICASVAAFPAAAQDTTSDQATEQSGDTARQQSAASLGETIVVTAQRRSEALQNVPIAVSAFSSEALEAQQIDNASDLQLTLPNVSFSKGNFTSASFTIRGIGDLCVGVTCDSATAIHTNGSPLFGTRIFETEYFDLERVEVLRGPQGTLFGRNATSGVVNVVTAKPDLSGFHVSGDAEYGNYDSIKAKGMINLPIGDTMGVRVAGFYLNRDGYTDNLYDNTRIDGRDMFAVRGSFRWEPSADTTFDLMGYYFREDDDRMRIQKQMCQRDPTGVLGCLNAKRAFEKTNGNSTLASVLTSTEFFRVAGIPAALQGLALGSVYDVNDVYANSVEPSDVRQVYTAYTPKYYADELQIQAHLSQNFGAMNLSLTGIYQDTNVDSSQDYNLGVQDRTGFATGLATLAALTQSPTLGAYFQPIYDALTPNGPTGELCTSEPRTDGRGAYEGFANCSSVPLAYDRSNQLQTSWSGEAILSSDFDGPLNFLLGGIYATTTMEENSYFVNAFGLDWASGVVGTVSALGAGLPPSYFGPSYYRNNTMDFKLDSYGIFGEVYYDISDRLKLTGGLRYNSDKKSVTARTTYLNFFNPFSNDGDPFDSPIVPLTGPSGLYDADAGTPGQQLVQQRNVSFDKITGRAVLDFQITPNNLLYASYSRGYKSGGINPPLAPVFAVPESFSPESIDAFEIGSKNTFANGALQLNATAFYYKYKNLQLSRIVARTSVNDNIDANIWGLELESVIRPDRNWMINLGFSYLHTEVAGDQYFSNPRDPGGGDPNAVIIKDLTNASLCAVTAPTAGLAAAYVTGFNSNLGLQGPTSFGPNSGIASLGAFSVCSALQANIPTGSGIQVLSPGVEVNLKGNALPQAPEFKASAGVQYTAEFGGGVTLVPRFDIAMTGTQYGNVFNGNVNRIAPFVQANAQIQLNGPDKRWYVRGYIQNIFDDSSVTGLYVTDASSGNFTNIFTLDPRRYGIGIGFNF